MSKCKDDLAAAMKKANFAIRRLFQACQTDDLLKPIIEPGAHPELWGQLRERFGDKSGLWKVAPDCANAVFWENYAKAADARANELTQTA